MADFRQLQAQKVASLHRSAANHDLGKQAASAHHIDEHMQFPVDPICNWEVMGDHDLRNLGSFVSCAAKELRQGTRLFVHCRQGLHRTGVGIWLLLKQLGVEDVEATMQRMRPEMHKEFKLRNRRRHLFDKAQRIRQSELYQRYASNAC